MSRIGLSEQLAPFRREIGALSIHPTWALEADLAGVDQKLAVETARRELLKWMANRVGHLPDRA